MPKVKKGRKVTASRPKSGRPGKAAPKPKRPARTKSSTAGPRSRRGTKPVAKPPVRSVRIRELDPLAKCGSETSVQFLYRVDELVDGAPTAHLVFFDRHGWYCEHGRNCPAVADVRKLGRQQHWFTD